MTETKHDDLGAFWDIFKAKSECANTYYDPPFKSGDSGVMVTEIQTRLNAKGATLTVDGSFGTKTANAVKDFQSKNGLPATGQVDLATWDALCSSGGGAAVSGDKVAKTATDITAVAGAAGEVASLFTKKKKKKGKKGGEFIESAPETNWLLWGSIAVVGVLTVGGIAYALTRPAERTA